MQFDLIEKNLSCATIPNFLSKVAYNSAAIIISCVVFVIWNQSLSHVAGKRKNKQKTNSQFSWILSLLISALGSLLTGSGLAAAIVSRLPHNLIQDHWRGAGKPEKPHKMFEQDTRWQYISFHSCCTQCARVILRTEKQILTKDSQRGDIWVETWRNSEVRHVHI